MLGTMAAARKLRAKPSVDGGLQAENQDQHDKLKQREKAGWVEWLAVSADNLDQAEAKAAGKDHVVARADAATADACFVEGAQSASR